MLEQCFSEVVCWGRLSKACSCRHALCLISKTCSCRHALCLTVCCVMHCVRGHRYLNDNQLSGPLPAEWGNMRTLRVL